MPHFTFIAIALCASAAGFGLRQIAVAPAPAAVLAAKAKAAAAETDAQKPAEPESGVTPIVLDLAADLAELTTADGGSFVSRELTLVRDRLFYELGIRVPGVRVRTGAPLPPGGYLVQVDEVPCASGHVSVGHLLALVPVSELGHLGVAAEPVKDPVTGRPAARVAEESRAQLEAAEVKLRTPAQTLCEHLHRALKRRASGFLGLQELQLALDQLEKRCPALVREAVAKVPLPLMTDVLRRLLHEEVSIRNLKAILEALVSPSTEGDAAALAEKCRQALARQLSHRFAPNGPLFAYLVDPAIEESLRAAGPQVAMEPQQASAIIEAAKKIATTGRAVLLSSPDVRRALRRLIEGSLPEVAVLTFSELDPDVQIRPVGRLVTR